MKDSQSSDLRRRFERFVRRNWHKSWRKELASKNENGAYTSLHLQNAWHNWRAGFLAGRKAHG